MKLHPCILFSLIRDTKESAEAALNASRAYQAIVDAINDAMNSSMYAITAADEAIQMVRPTKVTGE